MPLIAGDTLGSIAHTGPNALFECASPARERAIRPGRQTWFLGSLKDIC